MANDAVHGAAPGRAASDLERAVLLTGAVGVAFAVIAYPFTLADLPPLTDLPFHAAQASIFRHYFDPAFHFREQFTFQPFAEPHLTMYALGAFFALFTSIATATKLMAITMLALVPIGLAVLFHGMRKSPYWGLMGLTLTWCTVTQWGFLNFMGAFGLFAMSIGFALLIVDDPTPARRWGLALTLVMLFFTQVYRLPFALIGVVVAGIGLYRATERFWPLAVPVIPAAVLFAAWLVLEPRGLGVSGHLVEFHSERLRDIPRFLFGSYWPQDGAPPSFEGNLERMLSKRMLGVIVFTMAWAGFAFQRSGRAARRTLEEMLWDRCAASLAIVVAGGLLLGYFVLPYEAGRWSYIYPREIVGAALILMASAPDLPHGFAAKATFIALVAFAALPMSRFVSERFREFETATADFREISAQVPSSPRLFYLMYWLGDSPKQSTPFLHLPAWLQAEKGGALGFHFAQWNTYPIRYRQPGPDVPPPLPDRFERMPETFHVNEHGAWFDTFLVRHRIDPHQTFDADPSIHLVSHVGTWWLYRRTPTKT